jgi:hypothetical protein
MAPRDQREQGREGGEGEFGIVVTPEQLRGHSLSRSTRPFALEMLPFRRAKYGSREESILVEITHGMRNRNRQFETPMADNVMILSSRARARDKIERLKVRNGFTSATLFSVRRSAICVIYFARRHAAGNLD